MDHPSSLQKYFAFTNLTGSHYGADPFVRSGSFFLSSAGRP
jgi:hypothetical protein